MGAQEAPYGRRVEEPYGRRAEEEEGLAAEGVGVRGMGFEVRVWGLGFGVWGLGFGVWGLGFGVMEGAGSRPQKVVCALPLLEEAGPIQEELGPAFFPSCQVFHVFQIWFNLNFPTRRV